MRESSTKKKNCIYCNYFYIFFFIKMLCNLVDLLLASLFIIHIFIIYTNIILPMFVLNKIVISDVLIIKKLFYLLDRICKINTLLQIQSLIIAYAFCTNTMRVLVIEKHIIGSYTLFNFLYFRLQLQQKMYFFCSDEFFFIVSKYFFKQFSKLIPGMIRAQNIKQFWITF